MKYFVDLLQLIGGIVLSIGYIPQIKRIVKTKSVNDFSFSYLFLMDLGVGLMEIYAAYNLFCGVAIMFFVTNTMAFALACTVLVLFLIYKKK